VLRVKKRKREAIELLEMTVAMAPEYAEAWYNLALAHLGAERVDMHFHFGKVVKRFPDHYEAHYKLGAFYESLRYFEESAAAYRDQVDVNPIHWRAVIGLSRSISELIRAGKPHPELGPIEKAAEQDPARFLPYLGEILMALGEFDRATPVYRRYLDLLPPDSISVFTDLSLVAERDEIDSLKTLSGTSLERFIQRFWHQRNSLPTQVVNARYLEHLRRVHYAMTNYSEGSEPWDTRGEVYIRFGHPEHRSWSDHLVLETDPSIVKVKNRLMTTVQGLRLDGDPDAAWAFDVRNELGPNKRGDFAREVRGHPAFPVGNGKWESWIYPFLAGGVEVVFADVTGKYQFDFARPPSPRWRPFSSALVVERTRKRTPSVYRHDYGGDPLAMHLASADFRSSKSRQADLITYTGVPLEELSWESSDTDKWCSRIEVEVAVFDSVVTRVYFASYVTDVCVEDTTTEERGSLWVDAHSLRLPSGGYTIATQVRDVGSGRVQAIGRDVLIEDDATRGLRLSDPVVASRVEEVAHVGAFTRNGVDVLELPSKVFRDGDPVFLYYEIYGLNRDRFGKTLFRVDYQLDGSGQKGRLTLLGGITSLLGIDRTKEAVTFTYEQSGSSDTEPVYLSFDELQFGEQKIITLEIRVTDLVDTDRATTVRSVDFAVGETGRN
jgi:GWxTD domain-containing protein